MTLPRPRQLGFALIPAVLLLASGCGTRSPTDAARESAPAGQAATSSPHPEHPPPGAPPIPQEAERRRPVIDDPAAVEQRLADDLRYLASDELGGRGPFTEGLERAADHIARQLGEAGLNTRTFGESPFQVFRATLKQSLGKTEQQALRLRVGHGAPRVAVPLEDFIPLSLSASGDFDLPLVFAGYGVTRDDTGWDDYAEIDARGAMVIVLRHEPPASMPVGRTRKEAPSEHGHLARKVANARAHGAAGVLFVTDARHLARPRSSADVPDNVPKTEPIEGLLAFHVEGRGSKENGPVLHVTRTIVDEVLRQAGQPPLAEWEQQLAASSRPRSFPLPGCRAVGTVAIERRRLTLKNVVASLPGTGPHAAEVVIVGAHYDHLGTGGMASLAPWTVAVHNGADDNGSGSAALLEVARQVVARRGATSRSILFVAFSAEEMGLVGSEKFVAASPVPLRDVAAMVNLDMVGRLRNQRLTVAGTGTATAFPPLITRLGSEHRFRLRMDPSGYGPSDHATFCSAGVPVLHFFTGLHEDYHRPSDDFDKINLEGMRRIVAMVTDTVLEIAHADERPRAAPERLAARRRPSTAASTDATAADSPARPSPGTASTAAPKSRGVGITIETQPEGVVRITRVAPGSAAHAAQLRPGDIVRQVQGTSISHGQQVISRVRELTESGKVTFRVERGDTQLEVDVALRAE